MNIIIYIVLYFIVLELSTCRWLLINIYFLFTIFTLAKYELKKKERKRIAPPSSVHNLWSVCVWGGGGGGGGDGVDECLYSPVYCAQLK